ncbi:AFG1/ZapE family ATPase [Nocardia sp. 2YAB30]|uniref:AFG1/ZapE family ATPase n=1 Tax=unclassified Nocardia TaxID=2637762 RepID=UPI003F9B3938
MSVDGPTDYRTRGKRSSHTGFAAGRYVVVGAARQPHSNGERFSGVGDQPAGQGANEPSVQISIGPRRLHAATADSRTLTIDFVALCGAPTSAADYVELAQRFRRWEIRNVPLLREVPPDWAMRLVNVIDVLYDSDRELTVCACAAPSDLVEGVREVPDIPRLTSRLCELSQSTPASVGQPPVRRSTCDVTATAAD